MKLVTEAKRIKTNNTGVYYKQIKQEYIDKQGRLKTKDVDKIYIVIYKINGKTKTVTIGKYSEGIREAYCKTKRDEFVLLAKNGELPEQLQKKKKKTIVTFDDLADKYFNDREDTRSLSQSKGRYKLHLKPKLGNKDIHSLTKDDFKAIQTALKKAKKRPSTINGILTLASSIVNHSIKEDGLILKVNPTANIKPIRNEKAVRDRFLSLYEIKKLMSKVRYDDELCLFVKMALTTGARLEGVLNIKKSDIDIKHNTIKITDFKNKSTYTAHFTDELLKEYVKNKLLKLKKQDRLIEASSRTIQRKLKSIMDRLFNQGLDSKDFENRVVVHTLRHTFASHLAINGVPIYTIKNLMNHRDIAMTERYAKLSKESGASAVRGIYD